MSGEKDTAETEQKGMDPRMLVAFASAFAILGAVAFAAPVAEASEIAGTLAFLLAILYAMDAVWTKRRWSN